MAKAISCFSGILALLDVRALAAWLAGRKEADIVTKTASRVIVPSIMDDTLGAGGLPESGLAETRLMETRRA